MPINSLEDLVYALLTEIGFSIDESTGLVYDLETDRDLIYMNKKVRASVNPDIPAIPSDIYAIFDPIWDNKFMSTVLGYYLKKEEAYGNFQSSVTSEEIENIPFYNKDIDIKTRRSRISVTITGVGKVFSNFYYQKGLKYSDLILRLGNHPCPDLSKFDSIPEEAISVVPMVTNVYPKESIY